MAADLIVWVDRARERLVRGVGGRLGASVVAIGGPPGDDAGARLADEVGVESFDDLRAACARRPDAGLLLCAPVDEPPGRDPRRVASLFPIPSRVADMARLAGGVGRDEAPALCRLVPTMRSSSSVRSGGDLLEAFGPVRSLALRSLASPDAGGLAGRLVDAMGLLCRLIGDPELLDGAYSPAGRARLVHGAAPDRLDRLAGDMTINARFADGRAASIVVSDNAPAGLDAHAIALGEAGRLDLTPWSLVWTGPDGRTLDRLAPAPGAERTDPFDALCALIAEQTDRTMGDADGPEALRGFGRALAMSEAALLSARTGESESPGTILRMVAAG